MTACAAESSRLRLPRPAWAMVLALLGVGLVLFHGRLVSSDEMLMARQAVAMGLEGRLTFPAIYGRTTSQYGILCGLQCVPWVWVEAGLRAARVIGEGAGFTLAPLANLLNSLLLALYFRALARRLGAGETAASVGGLLLVAATPLLPYAESGFSESATALALTAAAFHLGFGSSFLLAGLWIAAGLHLRVITVALWPLWAAWAWQVVRSRGEPPREAMGALVRLSIFPAIGVVLLLIVNTVLRGGPLRMGYETSEFTTPLATGLHGLLLSPDRGLLVQAPLAILGVWGWAACRKRLASATAVFSLAIVSFWVLMHATFWTWHGGWTPGPRFLLPVLPFVLLPLPLLLGEWPGWGAGRRLVAAGVVGWAVAQSVVYTLVNPLDWNNELWGFLDQTESRFLFEPQVSSWRGVWTLMGDGALRPLWWPGGGVRGGGWGIGVFFLAAGVIALAGGAALAGVRSFRCGIVETLALWRGWMVGRGRAVAVSGLMALLVLVGARLLGGPRGLAREVRSESSERGMIDVVADADGRIRFGWPPRGAEAGGPLRRLERAMWEGYLDLPLQGRYVFYLKARGVYSIFLNEKVLFANDDPAKPRHVPRAAAELDPGRYPVRIVFAPDREGGGLLHLFWQWPGEGIVIEPLNEEYLLPRELSGLERRATFLRRNGFFLVALAVLAAWIASAAGRRRNDAGNGL